MKGHIFVAVGQGFVHGGGQAAVPEFHPGTHLHTLAGACQTLPRVPLYLPQQQQLADSARGYLGTHQPGRQDLGVIDHQQVALFQIMGQLVKDRVQDLVALAVQHHQAGGIARLGGFLRNEFLGQVVPKIFF